MAFKVPTGGQFENPEPGSYIARCYGFIDLGTQKHQGVRGQKDWLSRDGRFLFELPTTLMRGEFNPEAKGKPHVVSVAMKLSLAPTAKLRKFIKGWRGKDLTKEQAEAFQISKVIGAPGRLSLVQSEDGEFINIEGISKLNDDELRAIPTMINKPIFFSLDPEEFKREVFDGLSDKTKDRIFPTPEYQALIGQSQKKNPDPDDAPFVPGASSEPVPTGGGNAAGAPPPASTPGRGTPVTEAEAANQVDRSGKPTGIDEDPPF